MKVKIIKKTIKEGTATSGSDYCIKSLYVSFQEPEIYEKIVKHLKSQKITDDAIEKFCKPNDYNGQISYAFGLNCSHFTFDRVERFGILDANIIFSQNEKGFVSAKIQVIDKKEQVNGYESPEDEVNGWANAEAEKSVSVPIPDAVNQESKSMLNGFMQEGEENGGLPF
jgi:hypothetical protein